MMCEYICAVYACRIGLYRCHICRCVAYGYAAHILFSHFSTADPKNTSSGSRRFSALICETKIKNVLHFK
ncbi:hypothetical protein EGK21_16515 [Enterobacter hormaechei]|nr:hypothetical protein EGK21_16515 [Enterobacter hormaechei]